MKLAQAGLDWPEDINQIWRTNMKRTLLASTALVAMSGVAFANDNISLGGSAEMGVSTDDNGDAKMHMDADVSFTMAASTDAGLSFGTALNFDDNAGENKYAIHVSGDFGKVTMGDTDGAFDWAMDELSGAGSIADNQTTHAGYNGNAGLDSGDVLRYENSFVGLSLGLSIQREGDDGGGDIVGAGIKSSIGDIKVGVGFQSNDSENIAGASVMATFGGITGGLNFSQKSVDNGDDTSHMGVGATYTVGSTAVNVNFGTTEEGDTSETGFGVAAQYDLGGAKLQFGYGNSEDSDDSWSLGLAMSF